MYISVVVCTYNRSEVLNKCIESIIRNNYPKEKYEVIIIDNNSKDNTKDTVYNYINKGLNIKYFLEENIGLSFARNKGIDVSKGNIIIFLDDDTQISKGYLQAIKEFYSVNPEVVFAAGKINPIWTIEKPKWFSKAFSSIVGETLYGDEDRVLKRGEMPIGANMIFKREVFDEVGKFNINLGIQGDKLYLGEESDLYNRIVKKGYEVYYIANASVDHTVHNNKVNKEYVMNRLILEGVSSAEYSLNEGSKMQCIYLMFRRGLILLLRDTPMVIISKLTKKDEFEKICKYKRSLNFIKTIIDGIGRKQ
ncbi:Glycosyl transferase, family 2 [Clostridium bornimense]|uniref:Glycosyl transferase, family 2 n=1 Tax=Clostridium bornimense TaxID=1216932 RepID=W6RXP3_9CLOT|nr:glycosyltransferase [Clostridium bornimense]CDM69228.1 Glycosyl transferase, family 2 [Clostridium bornimense]